MATDAARSSRLQGIPRGVWALGFVSLFMDISSEMIHALLPVYLVTVLGASMVAVGFIEGIAEATAMIVKVFSGALSDWMGKRKWLAAFGYGLAAVTKPIFPLATGLGWIVTARFVDRIGKGIRGAPRDALIADLTPAPVRGAAFGLRQSLDTIGAFVGPLAAIALMALTVDNFRLVFWIAVIPAFISFALIVFAVEESARHEAVANGTRLRLSDAKRLSLAFWLVVGFGSVLTLARFSEAFLILRAQNLGMPVVWVPAVLVVMNVVYAFAAYPAGAISDRVGRTGVLMIGIATLIFADLVLAVAGSVAVVMAGVALWGLHMGLTQGLLATLVADTAPADLRGSAFGIFNCVSGLALLLASVMAGLLWDWSGPAATFMAGAAISAFALAGLAVLSHRIARPV
ncbi:MAG: MFS transporter [Pseudorhodoplanes sp.]|nr:Inner membrane transport protein YajR [Pseudorhodoplanes sp.]MBW7948542.1 MFS transporter [Pseudorhodoplanes sp.]MCL4712767.1 MFS transporter [Pseudorhodoplanes sp.]MCQ3943224.1 MFS transporter [Alphaproteobacteria bacterium]GIK78987.1 MAG: MFS transporter [Alphaproteobacteria bacterium]